jgi:hypothetical protein
VDTIVIVIIVILLLLPEFFHGWHEPTDPPFRI